MDTAVQEVIQTRLDIVVNRRARDVLFRPLHQQGVLEEILKEIWFECDRQKQQPPSKFVTLSQGFWENSLRSSYVK